METQENMKKPAGPDGKMVAAISIIMVVAGALGGIAMVTIPLGGINSAALMGPLNVIAVFPLFAGILVLVSAVCIITAGRNRTLWWLMPVGAAILIVGWLAACKIFLNVLEKHGRKAAAEQSAVFERDHADDASGV